MSKLTEALDQKLLQMESELTHWAEENGFGERTFKITARLIIKGRPEPTFEKITNDDWQKIFSLPWNTNRQPEYDALKYLRQIQNGESIYINDSIARASVNRMFTDHNLTLRLFVVTPERARAEKIKFIRSHKIYKVLIE